MDQKSNKTVVAIIAAVLGIALVAGIAYAVTRPSEVKTTDTPVLDSTTQESTEQSMTPESTTEEASALTIRFTDNGFEKDAYTVKKGSTVTVKNDSSSSVQFSSDNHPSHTEQSELNMQTLSAGESGTFTVTKVGEWGFHDHIQDQYEGVLTVTE